MTQAALKIVGSAKPQYDEELRQWLAIHIEQYPHLTTAVLSRSDHIGKSRTALDSYLTGTYFLPVDQGGAGVTNSKIEDSIRAYRERVEGTERHGYINTFIETRAWKQFQHAVFTAVNENVITVVYGDPGVGKTRCANEFTTRGMTTSPISIFCSRNITTRYFVQKVARELNLNERHPTAELEDKIAEKLRKNPRPLFVDQANYLRETALGSICYWWDLARTPVVLLGTRDLKELFFSSDLTQDVRAQITSRVAMHYQLFTLTEGDVKAIAHRALAEDATDAVVAKLFDITRGNHRHVDMILPRFKDLRRVQNGNVESGQITLEAIMAKAGSRLMVD